MKKSILPKLQANGALQNNISDQSPDRFKIQGALQNNISDQSPDRFKIQRTLTKKFTSPPVSITLIDSTKNIEDFHFQSSKYPVCSIKTIQSQHIIFQQRNSPKLQGSIRMVGIDTMKTIKTPSNLNINGRNCSIRYFNPNDSSVDLQKVIDRPPSPYFRQGFDIRNGRSNSPRLAPLINTPRQQISATQKKICIEEQSTDQNLSAPFRISPVKKVSKTVLIKSLESHIDKIISISEKEIDKRISNSDSDSDSSSSNSNSDDDQTFDIWDQTELNLRGLLFDLEDMDQDSQLLNLFKFRYETYPSQRQVCNDLVLITRLNKLKLKNRGRDWKFNLNNIIQQNYWMDINLEDDKNFQRFECHLKKHKLTSKR